MFKARKFIGKCIYCGSTNGLTDEHAIPFGLKGQHVLEKASCSNCSKITSKFENSFQRDTALGIRTVLNLPTRHPKKRPKGFPMHFVRGEETFTEIVPVEDYVPLLVLPDMGPPATLQGLYHPKGLKSGDLQVVIHTLDNERGSGHTEYLLKKYNADAIDVPFEIKHDDFRRMIAKIAHCHAVFFYGYDGFQRFNLVDSILGRTNRHFDWVGSDGRYEIYENWSEDSTHVIGFKRVADEVHVRVKLWNKSKTPEYIAIVGNLTRQYAQFLDIHRIP